MSISNTTPQCSASLVRATIASLGLAWLSSGVANANAPDADTYVWSATLVSVDREQMTAVVQARIEPYAEIEGLDTYADGDRLILSWTGRSWAAGVRDLARDPELAAGTLKLPVEFVSTEREGTYLNFRIHVPEAYVETIAAMEPGTRVTGYSPREITDWNGSIVRLRHYNDVD